MKVRMTLLAFFSLVTMVGLNFLIFQKERILEQGRTILLELAPVDPLSLIQGYYMDLDYAINRTIANEISTERGENYTGYVVVKVDESDLATFERLHDPKIPLKKNEQLLMFKKRSWRVRLGAESYFFQEGHAKHYETAKYGELKVTPSGNTVLYGLRDQNKQPIVVTEAKAQ